MNRGFLGELCYVKSGVEKVVGQSGVGNAINGVMKDVNSIAKNVSGKDQGCKKIC